MFALLGWYNLHKLFLFDVEFVFRMLFNFMSYSNGIFILVTATRLHDSDTLQFCNILYYIVLMLVFLVYWVNSLAPSRFWLTFRWSDFQTNFNDWWLSYLPWNYPQMNVTGPFWWLVNIGSGNGLVLSGNKPLPEPMLTQIYVTIGITRPQWVKIPQSKYCSMISWMHWF